MRHRDVLQIRLLGTFDVRCGDKAVSITSRPAQSLFAYLVLHAGTAFRREKLAGQLWPESTEESARDYLRHALWRIRKALQQVSAAEYLLADDLTIAFNAAAGFWLDVAALRGLQGKTLPDEAAAALGAYQGELLPGFYEEWVVLEREQLQFTYEQRVAHLVESLRVKEDWGGVLQWSEKWIANGRGPEEAFRSLMEAHA